MKPVEIVLVYQSLLGIYGDRGNALVLRQRLMRGLERKAFGSPGGASTPS